MNKKTIQIIVKTLGLEDDKKFQKNVEIMLDKEASEDKVEKARKFVFETIDDATLDSEILANLSKTDEEAFDLVTGGITHRGDYSIPKMKAYLTCVADLCKTYSEIYYYRDMLYDILDAANAIGDENTYKELFSLEEALSVAECKTKIDEYLDKLLSYVEKNIKDADDKTLKKISTLQQKKDKLVVKMNSDKPVNAKTLNDENHRLLDSIYALNYEKGKVSEEEEAIEEEPEKKEKKNKKDKNGGKLKLVREKVSGKLSKPVNFVKKHYKVATALGLILVGIAVGRLSMSSDSLSPKNNDDVSSNPGVEDQIDENEPVITDGTLTFNEDGTLSTESETKVTETAHSIYANWSEVGCDYTESDVCELIKMLNGAESTMSPAVADAMIIDMVNNATVPAVNNAIVGSKQEETKELEVSDLFINNQPGVSAIEDMEGYMNAATTGSSSLETVAESALKDEVGYVLNYKEVDGATLEQTDPEIRLVWSRLAIGTNAIIGTLGEDFQFTVGDTVYTQSDINNYNVFEEIATQAKSDLGYEAKTLTK